MKLPCKQVVKYLLLFLILFLPFLKLTAQQFLTTINGWNAYVHLPDDYNLTGSQKYPTIIFFPGLGEVGSNPGAVIYYGPGSFIANGWNGNVVVNGVTVKPIIISLQPPAAFPQPSAIDTRIQTIKSLYRVDPNRLHLTGLSHGGWCTSMYVMGNSTYASNIASIAAIQAMRPDDNPAYPVPFTTYALLGGHWLGYEQSADFRDMGTIANTMNAAVPGSATFIQTNIAGGSHCCWNYWYDPNHTDNYVLNGVSGNWSIYQYMLTWSHSTAPPPLNVAPVANAGADITINLPTTTVTLNGSGTDADGSITSYAWTQVSGPSQSTLATPAAAQTTVNNLVQGVYQFQLRVTDNSGSTATDIIVVTVNPASSNSPPVANAGTDITITLPTNSVALNGSGTDADGTIASYTWTKTFGPAQFTIVSSASAQTTANNLVQGVYWFELKVTDNNGATAVDAVVVTVNAAPPPPPPNQAPVANAGTDITITLPTNSVVLNGSGTDADGTIASYGWTKTSGPAQFTIVSSATAQTTVNNLVEGIYWFELKVTDNSGATAVDVVVVTVNAAPPPPPPNQAPVANAGTDITITLPTNSVVLNGSGTDADGTIASYGWTKTSGPTQFTIVSAATAQTTVNNLVQGIYWFELKVTDNNGATAVDVVVVTVNAAPPPPPPNQAPVANAGTDITITLPTNSVALNGSGTDADGTIASYGWTKTSGPAQFTIVSAATAQTTINNLVQGIYWFELKVTDNNGATAVDVVVVTVNAAPPPPPPNQAPVANAGNDITITLPTNSVVLNGSGTDADGTIASYGWTKTSGPAQFTIVSAATAQTTVNNLVQGIYWFELKVTDNNGATAVDVVVVTVNAAPPPPNQAPVANAGNDITITLPTNSVVLNGSGTDADGTIASYGWTKTSGPAQFTIVSAATAQTTVNNLVQGIYWFELKVTDNNGATAVDVVVVTVNAAPPPPPPNQAPVANAGNDITITLPTNSVVLNGSGTDADGTIANYLWSKISGPAQFNIASPALAQTTVNNLVQGVYQFQLQVTDNNGATNIDSVTITVNAAPPPNVPPVAVAGNDITITLPTNSVVLNGSGTDANGTVTGYTWSQIFGPSQSTIVNPSSAQTSVNNLAQGIYWFQLKVTDNNGATGEDVMVVTVNPAPPVNVAPYANAGNDISITLPLNSVTLNGMGTDADGNVTGFNWTKISGPAQYNIVSPSTTQTTVNNLAQGVYWFQLQVTDNNGATGLDVVAVTVNPAPPSNILPVANAGSDITITLPVNAVVLHGNGTDADGTISGYSWTKISGPATFNIVSANAAITNINNLVQGVYKFALQVTDNSGDFASDTISVTVNAAGAGNCGCDVLLQPSGDGSIYLDMSGYNLQPGAKVCIKSGNYTSISLEHIKGTAAQPITIINCGGPVITGSGGNYGLRIIKGQYFRVTGTGDASQQYGFKVFGPSSYLSAGLAIADSSSDFEIDHIEVSKANVGFFIKTQPQNCNPGTWGNNDNNTMRNISLHDNYIHNTRGEGFYIGSSFYSMQVLDCSGNIITVEAQKIRGLKIYNNITDTTEWDGIQVGNAPENVEIYNNVVKNFGTINMSSQQAGIILGGKCTGKVYNNYILNGTGNGMQILGFGDLSIYNNIIANAGFDGSTLGQDAVIIDDRPSPGFTGPRVFVMNNTIVNPARNGFLLQNSYGTFIPGSLFYNNLVVKPGAAGIVFTPSIADSSNNISKPQIADAGFVNAAGNNYHLSTGSIAIDAGRNATAYGIARDYDGNLRPYGAAFDVGAYEMVSGAPPANVPPIANAGNNITITLPINNTTLTGSGSDADGAVVGYSWTKISGPAQFNIITPTTAQSSVNNLVQGVYQFELTVTDNNGATGKDTVTVTVNPAPPPVNQPPVANAGFDISITLPSNLVTLTGSGTDADGTIVSYNWTKILGPSQFNIVNPSSAQTVVNSLVEGVYEFQLQVTDNNGATDVDLIQVTVFAAPPPPPVNQPPVANAGTNINIVLPVNSVTLNGSGTDPDGTIASYSWIKILGPSQFNIVNPSNAQTVVNSLVEGIYEFQLQVTDNNGATDLDTIQVTVIAPPPPPPVNQPPVATAGANISIVLPVNFVALNGSGTDADGTIVSYTWTKILGPSQFNIVSPSSAQTDVNGMVEGIYQFQLQVTDNNGATDVDSILVTVFAAPPPPPVNQAPVANAGSNITITLPTNVVTLNGSGNDADGSIMSYNWTKISGPSQFNISNAGDAQTSVSNLVQGVYQFQLIVTDNDGATDADSITVTVLAANAPNLPPTANAGDDVSINLPINSVVLNGSGADADGTVVTFSWRKIAGPNTFNIISVSQPQTIVSDLNQGVYMFELKVTDNDGATGMDTVGVYVDAPPNRRPIAYAGDNKVLILPQNSVLLEGNASDPDGTITDYSWREISGPGRYRLMNPAYAQTMVDDLVEGTYAFEFEVTDNNGERATDTVEVTVKNVPESRVIIFPNPVKSIMNIQIEANTHASLTYITIYDVNGKVVLRQSFMRNQSSLIRQINISHLPNGPYFVEVTADINRKVTTKVIKE